MVSIGSADSMPGGRLPGMNASDRSASGLFGPTRSITMGPSGTHCRSSGQAVAGSSMTSESLAIWARQVSPTGFAATRASSSSGR
jgi:hypothetical protein